MDFRAWGKLRKSGNVRRSDVGSSRWNAGRVGEGLPSADMAIFLSPRGVLHFEASADLEARVADGLKAAADRGSAALLLHTATRNVEVAMPPAESFWRLFARRYFTALCHTDDPLALGKIAPPDSGELDDLVASAPPMTGAEYLDAGRLETLWRELDKLVILPVSARRRTVRRGG